MNLDKIEVGMKAKVTGGVFAGMVGEVREIDKITNTPGQGFTNFKRARVRVSFPNGKSGWVMPRWLEKWT